MFEQIPLWAKWAFGVGVPFALILVWRIRTARRSPVETIHFNRR